MKTGRQRDREGKEKERKERQRENAAGLELMEIRSFFKTKPLCFVQGQTLVIRLGLVVWMPVSVCELQQTTARSA